MSSQTRKQLQGSRPAPLTVSKSSTKIKKPIPSTGTGKIRSPVIVYLQSPKVIHVRPEEFMGMVQRLTGKQASSSTVVAAADSHDTASYSYTSCVRPADETMGMGIISSDGSKQKQYNSGVEYYGVDPFLGISATFSNFAAYSEAFWPVNLDDL
ncbi:protein MKS1-like [Juglans microcarpa x Juglans regia]|uniref:protein MKS1-like n=1 Tax=Juglans microcarpa x Juglans regia TaxID=2249226 RepID=UPI001B7F3FF3|nr:protein MKS1-like [Juglans microcarpa x Juglans regia]